MENRRALKMANEALERRGEWQKMPAYRRLHPDQIIDDFIMPLLVLGALVVAALGYLGWLDDYFRRWFGW